MQRKKAGQNAICSEAMGSVGGWNMSVLRVVRSLGRGGSACHKYHAKCFDDLTIELSLFPRNIVSRFWVCTPLCAMGPMDKKGQESIC